MRPGYAWWHVMWHTYGTWLPGDPRGFRNRHHRVHSSGDYKNPPPPGEHAGLHRYAQRISRPEVVLHTAGLRRTVLHSLRDLCHDMDCLPVAIAVCRVHVHLLAEMPTDKAAFDRIVARLKTRSSAAVRDRLPGRVWARGDKRVVKPNRPTQLQCVRYIFRHADRAGDAWRYARPSAHGNGPTHCPDATL